MTGSPRPPTGLRPAARVGRRHGLRGAVRLHPLDDGAAPALLHALERGALLWLEGVGDVHLEAFARHGDAWRARFDRVRTAERAAELVHATLWAPTPDAAEDAAGSPAPARAEVGRPVLLVRGDAPPVEVGVVEALEGGPANPLLRVRVDGTSQLLPRAAPYVREDDDGVTLFDPPDGLLDPA
ncbi:MAG: hypothetical protein RI554_04475 [Trueperaceae bacterium]|nr:hypothetical protein [Trueperaceae bacterium]